MIAITILPILSRIDCALFSC